MRECCANCGLDLRANDSGDGPAVFVILIPGAIGMLRSLEATLVALQYRHRDL